MKQIIIVSLFFCCLHETIAQQVANSSNQPKVMDGFPPTRESLVTLENFRQYPFSQWSFRNSGGPMHVLMMPRAGSEHIFKSTTDKTVGKNLSLDTEGNSKTFEDIFKDNYADGVIVLKDNTILYEKYWNGLSKDYQHVWFSVSKSMASSAFEIVAGHFKMSK